MRSWSALGTYVVVHTPNRAHVGRAAVLVASVLEEVDRAYSRFRADSELSRANAGAGRWQPASALFIGAVGAALWAAAETDGLVDPSLGDLVTCAGYDRTFASLSASTDPVHLPQRSSAHWSQIQTRSGAVRLPAGMSLDLGASGKAYASDIAALLVVQQLGTPVVVSIGGDVRAAAPGGTGVAWPVRIAPDPASLCDAASPTALVRLASGGLATSSRSARRWRRGGRTWHHVFDPRTRQPADGRWVSATAWGPTAVAANAASTAALVLGEDAPAWLEARQGAALLVEQDGSSWATRAWRAAVEAPAEPVS